MPSKLQQKLRELPDEPGCYLFRDRRGKIIYVGKAASLRKRVQSYFREANLRRGSPKLRGLVRSVDDFDILVVRNEAEALLTEGQLIKDYRPRYNVSFRDDKRFLLLRIDPREPFPMLKLCRLKRDDDALYLGPYASSAAARAALDFTEKKYGLRKCAPRVPDAQTYQHCLNDIIRFCSAPCIARISREDYLARVHEACEFLRGRRPQVLHELRATMEEAAARQDFERAGALRDTLLRLQAVVKQNARVASTPERQHAQGEAGVQDLQRVLGLPRPPRVIEGFDISNIVGTLAVASMVCAVDGLPQPNRYRRFRIKTVVGSDDPRMMREVVLRRYARLKAEEAPLPDLVLVDGGLTQLRAAREALAELGLSALPTAGLAKRLEEIYWVDGEAPLFLPRESPALRMLQRLRDEAHRFALTYHRALRNRRIRESALDEIEGIGPKRKQQLLQHFGSIRRLLKAGEAELAAVPGVGPEMAKLIIATLRPSGRD
ncbi:MAG: excinuclease ABC subunit UvrC [Lentisphaerae bacterium]|nr:excinuclease ABC subunit UvrC [Lentisphaerota bacterium]